MTYLIAVNAQGETADGRYKLVPTIPTLEMGNRGEEHGENAGGIYRAMLSAATIDVAGMAVKVPEKFMRSDNAFEQQFAEGWNQAIDALGIKP